MSPRSSSYCRRHDLGLLTRTSWTDARTALRQIEKGRASGGRWSLLVRGQLQGQLVQLGQFIDRNAGKVLFVGLLVLATFCVGLKSAHVETDVHNLWVQRGGRLEREQAYVRANLGEGVGTSSQLVIQTAPAGRDLLRRPEALLSHLDALSRATQVTVDMFELTWRLKDLCYAPNFPTFDENYVDAMLEKLVPCVIVTPLDCFWEGSKLLGPEFPVRIPVLGSSVQWTDLNPQRLVADMQKVASFGGSFPFDTIQDFMRRAGITTAYQGKPCLDPSDPRCPESAPNKRSGRVPDIGAQLTGGCYGFATKYMHWPEDLIVGGVQKNRSGHIVRAEALQSVVQLMAERDMYLYWKGHYRMAHLDWTTDKARAVLEAWQRKFAEEVLRSDASFEYRNATRRPIGELHVFTATSLADVMKDFSQVSPTRVALGCLLMVVYGCVSLWAAAARDNPWGGAVLGALGVLLAVLAAGAGLGLCALLGLAFNAATTQVLPSLALGLALDTLFLLDQAYRQGARSRPPYERTAQVLKCVGPSVLLAWAGTAGAFCAAALIPVPALRAFALQAAVLHTFGTATMLLLFPAAVSVDLRRSRHSWQQCCSAEHGAVATAEGDSQGRTIARPSAAVAVGPLETWVGADAARVADTKQTQSYRWWSLDHFASVYYAPFLQQTPVKVLTVLGLVALLAASAWGALRADEGLDLAEVVPGLQKAFDRDWKHGCITREQWFPNASDEGVLAYKLLVQTGRPDNPIDKKLVPNGRLVDDEGLVNPKGFYNYLSAWASNDALAYAASEANLRPEPRQWVHSRQDVELRVPKSAPLAYAQMPFYLRGLRNSAEVSRALESVWALCSRFETRGLPNFPLGAPFAFWEQHLRLRLHLLASLALALAAVFLVLALALLNLWAACFLVLVLASLVLELFGAMGFLGVRLSAVPAVLLVLAVGVGVQFLVHVTISFLTGVGNRSRRVSLSLEWMFAPVVHGAVSTLLGVLVLASSEFDFIVRHFFYVLSALVLLGLLNGLLFLPVLLSLLGPPGELVPQGRADRIATPSPEASPPPPQRTARPPRTLGRPVSGPPLGGAGVRRHTWADSLSTISEEPPSYHSCSSSHEIVLHPEVVVETTTVTTSNGTTETTTRNTVDAGDRSSSAQSSSSGTSSRSSTPSEGGSTPTVVHSSSDCSLQPGTGGATTNVTTKVTAKVKVELHAPVHASERSHKHRRRRDSSCSRDCKF
ncbi:protein patched isoform X2 [Amblyomma americanum]